MTHSSDYTITTVSSSVTQYNTSNSQPAPFRFGGPHGPLNLRSTCLPYAPAQNPDSSFVFSQVNCPGITSGGGGGGGIPESITARTSLLHWWKLSDGSATTGTDYGLSASAGVSDLTLDGVTTDAAGPSENGTPAAISFDGVNDSANVKLVDSGGTNTVVGDLIDTGGGFTLSLWIKDEKSPNYDSFDAWWQASSDSGLMSNNGFGGYAVANTLYSSIKLANGYRAIEGGAYPTSGYKNWIITYPDPADGSGRRMNVYFDGSEVAFLSITDATVTTAIPATANTRLSFGCITAPDGTTSRHTAPTLSDIRLYNKVLSGAEISAIAAGDWE
jgi:hypothetical protein